MANIITFEMVAFERHIGFANAPNGNKFLVESIMMNESPNIKFKELMDIVKFAEQKTEQFSDEIKYMTKMNKQVKHIAYPSDDNVKFTIGLTLTE